MNTASLPALQAPSLTQALFGFLTSTTLLTVMMVFVAAL